MSLLEQMRKQSNMSSIMKQVEKQSGGNKSTTESYVDARKWKLTRDASGNGTAVIRFLPAPNGEASPWVKMLKYNFQYPAKTGKWYIENSLYTLGKIDPCFTLWNELSSSSDPDDQLRAKAIQRVTTYISNILVVNDPAKPENNGKVFLYEYGPQIHTMIMSKLKPEFEDDVPINVLDVENGVNFKLRGRIGENKRVTYDRSAFDTVSTPIADDEEGMLEIWQKCYPLEPEIAPEKFKSYEVLEKRAKFVLGLSKSDGSNSGTRNEQEISIPKKQPVSQKFDEDDVPDFPTPAPKSSPKIQPAQMDEDDDDDLSYFEKLASS